MQTLNNWLLIAPAKEKTSVTTKSGHEIHIGLNYEFNQEYGKSVNKWNTLQHAVITGKVLQVSNKVSHFEYETGCEVKPDDTVIFHYMQEIHAVGEGRIDDNGNIFIPYETIFAVHRDGVLIPINGNIFVEAIIEEEPVTSIIIPDHLKDNRSMSKGIIRYMSSPVKDYKRHEGYGGDTDELSVGDTVYFNDCNAIKLEDELHALFEPGKVLYRMRRMDVDMVEKRSQRVQFGLAPAKNHTQVLVSTHMDEGFLVRCKPYWHPINDRILAKIDAPDKLMSKFIIINERYEELPFRGVVEYAGEKATSIKRGQHIHWHKGGATKIEISGEWYAIIREENVQYADNLIVG
jgi:co-chaperonin GroES (HSP10)